MTIAILIIVFILCGGYYFFSNCIKDNKKTQKNRAVQTQEDLNALANNICRNVNDYITRYNNALVEYEMVEQEKRAEISRNHDFNALTEFKIYTTEFQEQQENISKRIEHIKYLLEEENDFNTAFIENNDLKDSIEIFEHIIEKIKYIDVQRTSNNYQHNFSSNVQTELFNQNTDVDFFSGCHTKEEADKRYRSLSKAFHPDTGYGDTNLFQKMTDEYNNLKF